MSKNRDSESSLRRFLESLPEYDDESCTAYFVGGWEAQIRYSFRGKWIDPSTCRIEFWLLADGEIKQRKLFRYVDEAGAFVAEARMEALCAH